MNEHELVALLRSRFQAHTIFLYGSRARGDAKPESDWDLVCLGSAEDKEHHGWAEDGTYLDVFVYPELAADRLEPDHIALLDGRVLLDERALAAPLLGDIAAFRDRGPPPITAHHRLMLRTWVVKTLERARRGLGDPKDLEAQFRRHWLLKDLLEMSYELRGRWYPGPKIALAKLADEHPRLGDAFAAAYAPNADFSTLEALAEAVLA